MIVRTTTVHAEYTIPLSNELKASNRRGWLSSKARPMLWTPVTSGVSIQLYKLLLDILLQQQQQQLLALLHVYVPDISTRDKPHTAY
jgi:hypothetical protein